MLQVDYYRPRKKRTWPAIVMGVELMLVIGIAILALANIALDPTTYSDFGRNPTVQAIEHVVLDLLVVGLMGLWLTIFVWWLRGFFVTSNEIFE